MTVTPAEIGWGAYSQYEGPFFRGKIPYALPDDPSDNDKVMAVVTAAEGGHYDAVNMYDAGIVSVGLIQWINAGTHRVDDMLGLVAETCGEDAITAPLAPALKASNASFRKDARGAWRFFVASGEVVSDAQQRALFMKGCGPKGQWNAAAKAHAKLWASCFASIWENEDARKVQVDFTVPRLSAFLLPGARGIIYDDVESTGWAGAVRAAIVSYAVNLPTAASRLVSSYKSSAAKWSRDWSIGLLQYVVFGSNIGIWATRYAAIRPVLEKLYGVKLPQSTGDLRTWHPIPEHVTMPDKSYPIVMLPSVPGESAPDRIIRIFRTFDGCSLSNRKDELGKLVARGVDDPAAVVGIKTNCATSALGIMALAGVKHPLLNKKYVNAQAITWVRKIGIDLGALVHYQGPNGPKPPRGALLRYNTAGKNDDHVEWLLDDVSDDWTAAHGGGGRADNAITELEADDIRWNHGRPLVEWWDPEKLGIIVLPEESEDA